VQVAHSDKATPVSSSVATTSPGRVRSLVFCILCFLLTLGLSLRSGLLRSEFGRYQDEGMHYVTGLFVQDFLTSGQWLSPIHFARDYYLHLPKLALGQWPPGFSLMQTAWGLVFGISRTSMLLGMIVLTTWLAFLVYRAGEKYFGPTLGVLGAILLIAAPLTQEQTAMVMAEVPLAAASFLAIAAFVRLLESTRVRDAIAFALWTICAIMIKGNGWVIALAAPLILLLTGRIRLLGNKRVWLAVLLIALVCVPYTLITMRIVTQGWDTTKFPGWAYTWASLGIHLGFVAHLLGMPMTIVAIVGVFASLFLRRDLFWKAMVIYAAAIVAFHVAIPSSIEPRKVYQIVPVICLLVAAGLDAVVVGLLRGRQTFIPGARPALAALAGLIFFFTGFSLLPQYAPGFGPAVENIQAQPASRGAAILISSNPQWADSEAALIAEWAERRRNDGTYLIRATKLLSHPVAAAPGEGDWALNFTTPQAMLDALSSIPVSFVILHTTPFRVSYPHHDMLRAALAGDRAEWELVYHTQRHLSGLGEMHDIEIYRFRKNVAGAPIHYSVDLSGKLGSKFGAGE
jgi:hypothetical protein